MGAIGSIVGGIASARANRNARAITEKQRQANQSWFDRRYNEDATQRADAVRLWEMTQEETKNRNQQSAGNAAVMGGTAESIAQAKAANNSVLANTAANIAAQGAARKDNIEATYLQNEAALTTQQRQDEINRGATIAEAAKGVGEVAGTIAGAF